MKKLYMLGVSLFLCAGLFAQTAVTFEVNLGDNVPSEDGVHMAGNFNAFGDDYPEWDPSGILMSDDDLDNIYTVELMLSPGEYQFKFINGNDWDFSEDVPAACKVPGSDNRGVQVGMMPTSASRVCFSQCNDCDMRRVVFRVDMSLVEDGINPNGVHVAGSFQGWSASTSMLTDINGDMVFEYTYDYFPAIEGVNDTLEFKFINDNTFDSGFNESFAAGSACGTETNDNRREVISEDYTLLPAYCYNTCGSCVAPTMVTFRVDMTLETVDANGVHIAGSFQGWTADATPMTDMGSGIWEYTTELAPGDYQYKYINGNSWDGPNESVPAECNVGGNRGITVMEGESQEAAHCYNQCGTSCEVDPDPADITFSVDMNAVETISPDGVWLIGGFTNPVWQGGAIQMTDDNEDGIYVATLNVAGPANIQYKFVNGDVNVSENEENAGIAECGIDNGIGGFNRTHARTGTAETLEVVCFDMCMCDVSVEEIALQNSFKLYPNPASDMVNIQFTSDKPLTVNVLNSIGKVVSTQSGVNGTVILNTSLLASGLYTVQLSNETVSVNKALVVE